MKAPTKLPKADPTIPSISALIKIVEGTSSEVTIAAGGANNETASKALSVPTGYTLKGIVGYEVAGSSNPAYAKVWKLYWSGSTCYARMNNSNATNSCKVTVKFYGLCVKNTAL